MSKRFVLISGESGTGKSASLRNIRNPEKVMYLCTEAGKDLPFKDNFGKSVTITHPSQILKGIQIAEKGDFDTVIVDSLTFLFDLYESEVICKAENTMQAWGDFGQYIKNLFQQVVAKSKLRFIFLAHTRSDLDESSGDYRTCVPVKGATKGVGVESYFNVVISTKKVAVNKCKQFQNKDLTYNPTEERKQFKYVYQTDLTKDTVNERIRAPIGMFAEDGSQTYINNDIQVVMDMLDDYYK